MKFSFLIIFALFGFFNHSFGVEKLTINDVLKLEISDQKAHQTLDAKAVLGYTAPDFELVELDGKTISREIYALRASQLFERLSHYMSKRSNHKISISEDGKSAILKYYQEEKVMMKLNGMVHSSSQNIKVSIGIINGRPMFTRAEFIN